MSPADGSFRPASRLRAAIGLPLAAILPKAGVLSAVAGFLKVSAISTVAGFPAVAAAEFGATSGAGSIPGHLADAAAALASGVLAMLVWRRTRRSSAFQTPSVERDPFHSASTWTSVPTSILTPYNSDNSDISALLTPHHPTSPVPPYNSAAPPILAPGLRPPSGSVLRRIGIAAFAGLAAAFLAPGAGSAVVFGALGIGFGYGFASRSAAAKAASAIQQRLAAAPPAIELFAAGLTAGLLPEQAAIVVVDAFGRSGPDADLSHDPLAQVAESFRQAAAILAATADPALAWAVLRLDPATEPVGTAALRSSRTGAPLADAVTRAARATRIAARQAAQGQVRAVAVKAVAPLALCFLPAFVLIGIVPMALGLLHEFQR